MVADTLACWGIQNDHWDQLWSTPLDGILFAYANDFYLVP